MSGGCGDDSRDGAMSGTSGDIALRAAFLSEGVFCRASNRPRTFVFSFATVALTGRFIMKTYASFVRSEPSAATLSGLAPAAMSSFWRSAILDMRSLCDFICRAGKKMPAGRQTRSEHTPRTRQTRRTRCRQVHGSRLHYKILSGKSFRGVKREKMLYAAGCLASPFSVTASATCRAQRSLWAQLIRDREFYSPVPDVFATGSRLEPTTAANKKA